MAILFIAVSLAAAATLWYAVSEYLKSRKDPPGPFWLPILGYIPALYYSVPGSKQYQIFPKTLTELGKKYGPVFQLHLGSRRIVFLHTAQAIREAYKMEAFTGRPRDSPNVDLFRQAGEKELIFKDGPVWKMNRRISTRAISLFSSSKNCGLEKCVHEGLRWFLAKIKDTNEQAINVKTFTIPMTGAWISSMCLGTDPNPDDPFFRSVINAAHAILQPGEGLGKVEMFPFLSVFYKGSMQQFVTGWSGLVKRVMGKVSDHVKTLEVDMVTNMVAAVEKAIRETPDAEKSRLGTDDAEMRCMLFDLFDVGFFTSSETISWALLALATFPEIQQKVADEVHEVVPEGHLPSLTEDLDRLPYARATIYELQRYVSMFPFNLPHRAIQDTEFMGYTIRKDTTVSGNTYAVHHDPEVFPDPNTFKPERFLDSHGRLDSKEAEKVMIYGTGRRRCSGEAMVLQTLPTSLAAIIQNFKVELDPETKGDPLHDLTFLTIGSMLVPAPHKLVFRQRAYPK